MAPKPIPTSLTLFFKHNKATVLLSTAPLAPLPAVKAQLLSALQTRYPQGLEGTALPASAEEIRLAKPAEGEAWTEVGGEESLAALGVRDCDVLAFKWRGCEWNVEVPVFEDEDEE